MDDNENKDNEMHSMVINLLNKYALFVPLYNIEVAEELLDINIFANYRIVRSINLPYRYGQYIVLQDHFARQLIQDITERHPEKSVFYPSAKYVICAEFQTEDEQKTYENKVVELRKDINNFILALRLSGNGFCQINNSYFLSNGHSGCSQCKTSSQLMNASIAHITGSGTLVCEDIYNLNKEILDKTLNMLEVIENLPKNKCIVPIAYFNKYYDSLTPYERIIQLAVVLESTILSGRNEELGYRLCLRTMALLGKDVNDLINLFYSVRSNVVHNGYIGKNKGSKDIIKKLKKITGITDREDEVELLFYFIKDHIEPIIKEILNRAFVLFGSRKIEDFDDLNHKLDEYIIQQIIKEKFEV